MSVFSESVVPVAKTTIGYAEAVTKDIPAEQFGCMPEGITTNSPAWVIGHLGAYPGWILATLKGEAPPQDDETQALFGVSSTCQHDPDGTIYPGKDQLLQTFNDGMRAVIEALPSVPDETLLAPNPNEKMRDRFPTTGCLVNFMLGSHAMMHLGQVSAWRRCMGMGPCM